MNINMMRKIDQYVGPFACKTIGLFRKLFRFSRKQDLDTLDPEEVRNILIIKYFGIGSILLASPAIRRLKQRYPQATVTIVTLASNRALCEMLPSIDNVLCLRIDTPLKSLKSYLAVLGAVRRKGADILMDLEFFTNFSALTALLVMCLTPVRVAIGFNSHVTWRNKIYHTPVCFDHSRHISKIFLKVVRVLCGYDSSDEVSFEPERKALRENADPKYYDEVLSGSELPAENTSAVCININAGPLSLHRRWPREYFLNLVGELSRRKDILICLIGGKDDSAYVTQLHEELPASARVLNLAGKTNVAQLLGLFSRSRLLITNDGGPLHLAHIIGLPTVSFFGPETPHLYGPVGEDHYVFYEDLFCSPCLNIYNSKLSHCEDNTCLARIKPERVWKLLAERYL